MEFSELSDQVNSISEIVDADTKTLAVYYSEMKELYDTIKKYRDWFWEHRVEYGISFSKLLELDLKIAFFPTRQFGEMVIAGDYNILVDALKIICEISTNLTPNLYWKFQYLAPSLQKYYTSYLSGHLAEYQSAWVGHGLTRVLNVNYWYMQTSSLFANWMGAMEAWYQINKHLDTCRIKLVGSLILAPVGKLVYRLVFVKSGFPFSDGSLHVNDSPFVTKVGTWDWLATGSSYVSIDETIAINDDVQYVVACIVDEDNATYQRAHIHKLSLFNE